MLTLCLLAVSFIAAFLSVAILASYIGVATKYKRCRKEIEATVIEIVNPGEFDENNIKKKYKRGICEFEHSGIIYETKYMNFNVLDNKVEEGDEIQIHINLNDPKEAVIKNKNSKIVMGTYIGAMVFALFITFSGAYQVYYILNFGHRVESRPTDRDNYTETPIQVETAKPREYSMVKVNYLGVINSLPSNFTKPIYDGNDVKRGACMFYEKGMQEKICTISVQQYIDKGNMRDDILQQMLVDGSIDGIETYKEPVNIEKETINGIEYEMYKKVVKEQWEDTKYYFYYAFWFVDDKCVLVSHRSSEEQLRDIVGSNLNSY